jgi:Flp pilus assembly protein TadD
VNTGRGPEALAQAEEAVRLGPANPQNHLTLAILLDQSGQRNRAITEFQRTLKLAPNSAVAKRGIQGPLNSAPPRR